VAAYHKGYTKDQRKEVDRERKKAERKEQSTEKILSKEVIVWDGEGMKLSGPDQPQHYVLFGCSVEPDSPLVITEPNGRLTFEQIADYCLDIVKRRPNAIHLGYFFKYDQNMIIWSLPWPAKQTLYSSGTCMVKINGTKYYLRCVFGKFIRITRIRNDEKLSILIEDFAPFFASSFVKAYETLFPHPTDPDNWGIVVQGKKDRSDMMYPDLQKVRRYWRAEIIALHELAFEFRRLMFDGGFMLSQWHGPGALANYIRRNYGLIPHEWGGKEDNMSTDVHEAVRGGYYGGHFEQFKVGFIKGPIYSYDRNSAYPFAFCEIPTLQKGGFWRNVGAISAETWKQDAELRTSFALFYVRWEGTCNHPHPLGNRVIQPLPHRSKDGDISYPQITEGWYWAPEVNVAMKMAANIKGVYCTILNGWQWVPTDESYPWEDVIRGMYARRRKLQDNKNPTQMAFKLGPNSMYGKAAQRAGGKTKAPQSHTLPVAGYITSSCRAAVMDLMGCCKADTVISVETDGVFTTTPPEELAHPEWFPLSKELGEWTMKKYDNMVIIQNGVYLLQKDGEWEPPKSRGIPAEWVKVDSVLEYLTRCTGNRWPTLTFNDPDDPDSKGRETFIGLGTAIARCTLRRPDNKWRTNPYYASLLHCTWAPQQKEIDTEGRNSKRSHFPQWCRACKQGLSPAVAAHDLVIHSKVWDPAQRESYKYQLPWMKDYVPPIWELTKEDALTEDEAAEE